jgi:26S proteasome non-ATPase regulatory subunit 10
MRALLAAKASPSAADKSGRKPLTAAAEQGRAGAVRLLLEQGLDASGADLDGCTALHHLVRGWQHERSREYSAAAAALIKAGADVHAASR